jgi:ABC-type proline/glycine betaine transport system ATPase subunit
LDNWTPDRDNAHDFGVIGRAMKFAKKIGLPDLELIVSVDDPQQLSSTPFQVFLRKFLRAGHS